MGAERADYVGVGFDLWKRKGSEVVKGVTVSGQRFGGIPGGMEKFWESKL